MDSLVAQSEPIRVWQSGEWTILHVTDGSGTQTTSSLTRDQARALSQKLRNSPATSGDELVDLWNYATDYREHPTFEGFIERAEELGVGPRAVLSVLKDDDGLVERRIAKALRDTLLSYAVTLRPQTLKIMAKAAIEASGRAAR